MACLRIWFAVGDVYYFFWTRRLLGFLIPVVLLRCFGIPYVASAVLFVLYLVFLIKYKAPKREWFIFVLIFVFCILGLSSLEVVFHAAMSV